MELANVYALDCASAFEETSVASRGSSLAASRGSSLAASRGSCAQFQYAHVDLEKARLFLALVDANKVLTFELPTQTIGDTQQTIGGTLTNTQPVLSTMLSTLHTPAVADKQLLPICVIPLPDGSLLLFIFIPISGQ